MIELNDETYNRVMASPKVYALNGVDFIGIEKGIYYGTPLPEHHGRLISEEDMLSVIMFSKLFDNAKVGEVKEVLLNIPTIIEGSDPE